MFHFSPWQADRRTALRSGDRSVVSVLALAVVLSMATISNARTPDESDATTSNPCLVEPNAEPGDTPDDDKSLTEKLDRCNGVLKPPPTEDQEIEEPPPDTGKTPVIPPDDIPEQQAEEPD